MNEAQIMFREVRDQIQETGKYPCAVYRKVGWKTQYNVKFVKDGSIKNGGAERKLLACRKDTKCTKCYLQLISEWIA